MIDISRNVIQAFISEKGCKEMANKPYFGFSDKQIRSVFTDYLKHKNEKENFYFTKNTVERILRMDISKVEPKLLSFLGEKYNKEFALCFLEKENISFCYTIDFNTVKLLVFNGNKKTTRSVAHEGYLKNTFTFDGFEKSIIGSAIINFHTNELTMMPCNALYQYNLKKDDLKDIPTDYVGDLIRAAKNADYMKALERDYQVKNDTIFVAVKSFVFLKTASVIDKTFISEDKKFLIKNKYGVSEKRKDITVINSFYDESINVINPFPVSGHFRNQPYKNGIEMIYIDAFMKKGYKRPAKILNEKNNKE